MRVPWRRCWGQLLPGDVVLLEEHAPAAGDGDAQELAVGELVRGEHADAVLHRVLLPPPQVPRHLVVFAVERVGAGVEHGQGVLGAEVVELGVARAAVMETIFCTWPPNHVSVSGVAGAESTTLISSDCVYAATAP
jgi:hypothetical protein